MNVDLATQMVSLQSVQTQNSVQLAVLKKTHEMETNLLKTLMGSAPAAPPPGQGTRVDKQA